jgi:hypothetical protein
MRQSVGFSDSYKRAIEETLLNKGIRNSDKSTIEMFGSGAGCDAASLPAMVPRLEGAGAGRAKPVGHYSEARKTRIGSSIEAFEAITKDAVSPRIWKPRAWERSAGQARLAQLSRCGMTTPVLKNGDEATA